MESDKDRIVLNLELNSLSSPSPTLLLPSVTAPASEMRAVWLSLEPNPGIKQEAFAFPWCTIWKRSLCTGGEPSTGFHSLLTYLWALRWALRSFLWKPSTVITRLAVYPPRQLFESRDWLLVTQAHPQCPAPSRLHYLLNKCILGLSSSSLTFPLRDEENEIQKKVQWFTLGYAIKH